MSWNPIGADMPTGTVLAHPLPAPAASPAVILPLARDVAVACQPADARRPAASTIGEHISRQLQLGRSLLNVITDASVAELLGADGRARTTPTRRSGVSA